MSELRNRILKSVKNPLANIFSESAVVQNKAEYAPTIVPMLNVALSGKWDGGLYPGITMLAGPSKMGKTFIGLVFVKAYLDKYPDSYCVFIDSELGANVNYFENLGIDMDRIIHIPIKNIEEAKFQTIQLLEDLNTEDKVIFFFDSIGNVASKKELEDAISEKSVADMSRAKQLKSFFRMITPYVNWKQFPFVAINHTYESMDMFNPSPKIGGGTGAIYAADTIFVLSKSKEKDGSDVVGFNFTLRVEKSRCIREGTKFKLTAIFGEGIDKQSDLFDFALDKGYITSPSKGFYQKHEKYGDPKKYRASEFDFNDEIWKDILADEDFRIDYEKSYRL